MFVLSELPMLPSKDCGLVLGLGLGIELEVRVSRVRDRIRG